MALRSGYGTPLNITTATTTTVKSGQGDLIAIIVNKAIASATLTIYDSLTATGTIIATVTFPGTLLANQVVLPYFCQFGTGLTIVTSGATDITVSYN